MPTFRTRRVRSTGPRCRLPPPGRAARRRSRNQPDSWREHQARPPRHGHTAAGGPPFPPGNGRPGSSPARGTRPAGRPPPRTRRRAYMPTSVEPSASPIGTYSWSGDTRHCGQQVPPLRPGHPQPAALLRLVPVEDRLVALGGVGHRAGVCGHRQVGEVAGDELRDQLPVLGPKPVPSTGGPTAPGAASPAGRGAPRRPARRSRAGRRPASAARTRRPCRPAGAPSVRGTASSPPASAGAPRRPGTEAVRQPTPQVGRDLPAGEELDHPGAAPMRRRRPHRRPRSGRRRRRLLTELCTSPSPIAVHRIVIAASGSSAGVPAAPLTSVTSVTCTNRRNGRSLARPGGPLEPGCRLGAEQLVGRAPGQLLRRVDHPAVRDA